MNERVALLFHELADLPAAERARYWAEHSIDAQTRRELEELLACDAGADIGALERDIGIVAGRTLAAHRDAEPQPDLRCGPFRLVRVIGRGGMGVVYEAERADGELQQRAAVKLLRFGGQLDEAVRERFLQERQILASLSHPNIARLLDAGHLEDGQPYLTMEFVEGKPVDEFADGLPIRKKIELLLNICGAVAYLHRNLVVHRDLKPGNILVTAAGEPKILDFGIAKILDLATNATMTGMRMLTPDYASPEQAAGASISTASDVYSLAGVLYRLLTGQAPRAISRISSGGSAAASVSTGVTRPSKLVPALRGDLETILLKALRQEPSERYSSVDRFAEDLQAYLDSRPIAARQGDWVYRTRKVARRYWLPTSVGLLVVAGLGGGLLIVNRERALAQRRFMDVRQLANRLFDIDEMVRQLPNSTASRQLIVDTSLEYLSRLSKEAADSPDLALELGTAYQLVARVQGIPLSPNLGQAKNAAENLAIAERLLRRAHSAQPENRTAILRLATVAHDQMSLAEADPKADSLILARRAEEWLQRYLASGPVDPGQAREAISIALNVANNYQIGELTGDALRLLRQMKGLGIISPGSGQMAGLHITMARIQRRTGDFEGALAVIRETTRSAHSPPTADSPVEVLRRFRLALATEGDILYANGAGSLGRPGDAAAVFERAVQIGLDLAKRDPNNSLIRMGAGSDLRRWAGALRVSDPLRAMEALAEGRRQLEVVKNNPRARLEEIQNLADTTQLELMRGRRVEARRFLDRAFEKLRELKLYPSEKFETGGAADLTLRAQAEWEAARGDFRRAADLYRDCLAAGDNGGAKPEEYLDNAVDRSNVWRALSQVLARAGDVAGSAQWENRRLALWRHWERKLPGNPMAVRAFAEK